MARLRASAQWLARALQAAGTRCATIGTLGTGFSDALTATGFTTPDAVQLQDSLAELNAAGARAVAMEVSSHGLEQGRVAGTHFTVAVLTNLTQDHLDYHGTMAEYEAAKACACSNGPACAPAVINRDDAMGRRLLAGTLATGQVIEYGIDGAAGATRKGGQWLRATGVRATAAGTAFHVDGSFGSADVATPMIRRVQCQQPARRARRRARQRHRGGLQPSTRCARSGRSTAAWSCSVAATAARMARWRWSITPHTPDAAGKDPGRAAPGGTGAQGPAVVVFGCGGDRDPIKRPLMGAVAARLADEVVLTSDNPRSEDPLDILNAIADGIDDHSHTHLIEDRAAAILYAIKHATAADVVLVAGKGHEATQEVHGRKRPFSDREHVRLTLGTRGVSA
ncbi:Mur ligase family protein [Cupriavidus basilensis]